MRLALKLLSSLAAVTILVLGLGAWAERHRQEELLSMDLDAEARLGTVLRALVVRVSELDSPESARMIIETVNDNLPARSIRWLEPDRVPQIPGRDLSAELAANMTTGQPVWIHWPNEEGESLRYVYIPVAHEGKPLAVIEASQSMQPRHHFIAQARMQTAAVGLLVLGLSGALAAILGRRLIGQPVAALARSVRTLANGEEFVPPAIETTRRDELGSLAAEVSALGERLAERERMRHDDRLRTVGQLASGVAHELGTPLSVIAVRARMISSGEAKGPEVLTNATAILEQSERMTRLVRQLLDYSRRNGGGSATDLDLKQVLLRTVEMLEPLARTHNVSIVAEAENGDLQVRGDGAQLQQVLTNLVLNAVQAMPAGGRIEVRCGRELVRRGIRTKDECWMRVTDDGPGIPPGDLAHVFEPFFTTKNAGEGTGLGLAVAQAIVEEHGGSIAVHSEPGRGASFTIRLPPLTAAARLAS